MRKKADRNNFLRVAFFLAVISYVIFRLDKGLPYVVPYFKSVLTEMVYMKDASYDNKMLRLFGSDYIIYKNIKDTTSLNDVICIQGGDSNINSAFGAYFLYPEVVKKIPESDDSPVLGVNTNMCTYLILYKNKPDFDINVQEIILFSNKPGEKGTTIKVNKYIHDTSRYANKTGIIKL